MQFVGVRWKPSGSNPIQKPVMKPRRLVASSLALVLLASAETLPAQTTYVWDNGGGTSVINTATNWNADGTPTSTASVSDTARWDGSVAGNLVLTLSGSVGGGSGTAGIILDVTGAQTGSLSATGNTIRVKDINIASGAGAVTFGPIQIGGLGTATTHTITNNSANGATQGNLLKGGGNLRDLTIAGSGDYTINGRIDSSVNNDSNGFNLIKNGSGRLYLTVDSFNITNVWNSALTITNGPVRVSNSFALGAAGSGAIGITTIGANSSARLELTGGISVAETLDIKGKSGASTSSHILNVGGNNSITGAITLNTGGNDYNFSSDSGKLTVSSNLAIGGGSTASKILRVAGAGDVELSGHIGNGTGTINTVKTGGGTLTLSNGNNYTGTTSVNEGTLAINGNQSTATGNVSVSNTGTRLIGTGTVGGSTTINAGAIHSAGGAVANVNKVEQQAFSQNLTYASGSIFEWDLNANKDTAGFDGDPLLTADNGARGVDFDAVDVAGNLTVGATAIFKVIVGSGVNFAAEDNFWTQNREWSDIFNVTGTGGALGWFDTAVAVYNTNNVLQGVSNYGAFTINGSTLTWTAVPEPTSALAGLLLASGLLRRRRRA